MQRKILYSTIKCMEFKFTKKFCLWVALSVIFITICVFCYKNTSIFPQIKTALEKTFLKTESEQKEAPTLSEEIYQLLVIGYTKNDSSYEKLLGYLNNNQVAGVVLYGRNIISPKSIKKATKSFCKHSKNGTPFVMIDQEGGNVSRINAKNGFVNYPSAKNISIDYKGENEAYSIYYDMAKSLKEIGVNFNLAPCVDLSLNNESHIVKEKRSYGKNKNTVTKYAKDFVKAHLDNGVAATLKHYPGIGTSSVNTHDALPDITNDWSYDEVAPYKEIIKTYPLVSVMAAHVLNKKLDANKIMSTSHKALSLLRKNYKLRGLILVDAPNMAAVENQDLDTFIIEALNAGVDLFVFPNHSYLNRNPKHYMTPAMFHSIVMKAYNEGLVKKERIDAAYNKVMFYKQNVIWQCK